MILAQRRPQAVMRSASAAPTTCQRCPRSQTCLVGLLGVHVQRGDVHVRAGRVQHPALRGLQMRAVVSAILPPAFPDRAEMNCRVDATGDTVDGSGYPSTTICIRRDRSIGIALEQSWPFSERTSNINTAPTHFAGICLIESAE